MPADPYIIGIGGGTGAGKTTIATRITEIVESDITLVSLDNYYCDQTDVPLEERKERNYDHPDAIDWDLLIDHLEALARGDPVEMPQYDFERHTRAPETTVVDPDPIVILEGIFSLYHDAILETLDLAIYVQTDADVRVLRRLQRDVADRDRTVESVIDQYLSTVKPMHEQFVEPTKRDADIIIPEGVNTVAIDLLQEKIVAEIDERTTVPSEIS
ncbi:MAG: uridine kinase [Halobacteriaceae archaeon]